MWGLGLGLLVGGVGGGAGKKCFGYLGHGVGEAGEVKVLEEGDDVEEGGGKGGGFESGGEGGGGEGW